MAQTLGALHYHGSKNWSLASYWTREFRYKTPAGQVDDSVGSVTKLRVISLNSAGKGF